MTTPVINKQGLLEMKIELLWDWFNKNKINFEMN